MLPGVEYRTTERHNGKVVYRKMIEYTNEDTFGEAGTWTELSIEHGVSNFSDTVRCDATQEGYTFPFISLAGYIAAVSWVTSTYIYLRTNTAWTSRTWKFDLAYTKNS